MKIRLTTQSQTIRGATLPRLLATVFLLAAFAMSFGCHSSKVARKKDDFFTSGSREADQRASQRMARDEQLTGSGEGAGEKGAKKAVAINANAEVGSTTTTNKAAQVEGKLALYDRLGGQAGISNIVADFTPRALKDPRVNWTREGVTQGGFSFHRGKSVAWDASAGNISALQRHLSQFLALATGGPSTYEGKGMKAAHAHMHIANAEFDAAIGDLKASLDRLQIPNKEQKELLAIIESARPQIVEVR